MFNFFLSRQQVMKTLNSTLQNFACPESEEFMNGAILNLNSHVRSNLSEIFLEDLVKNFNGALYSFNGPLLVTRVVKTLCNVKSITEITPMQDCHGFHVLKQNLCYPIEYEKWEDLLTTKNVHSVMKKVEKSLVVHFWNKFSKNKRVDVKSEVPYAQLARKSCPKLIKTCDKNF